MTESKIYGRPRTVSGKGGDSSGGVAAGLKGQRQRWEKIDKVPLELPGLIA